LVEAGDDLYLVAAGRRHLVPRAETAGVLRAIGQDTALPWSVTGRWLNLLEPGADLEPVVVPGAGEPLPDGAAAPPGTVVGTVLVVTDSVGGSQRYVVDERGELAPLTPFATPLYALGSGAQAGGEVEVTASQVSGMRTASSPAAPADWPTEVPGALPEATTPCVYLDGAVGVGVHLVGHPDVVVPEQGDEVRVEPAGGALVRAEAGGAAAGVAHLVDQTGVAYPVPLAGDELARLGYTEQDVTSVPQPWLSLLATGPELSVDGAAQGAQTAQGTDGTGNTESTEGTEGSA
ncbi:type VII secretion protein EccB, partial [Actinotalea sp. C106]|uniref:type VII secretion protein EccB n=1 Tax=Actinotalea sp. C106 TaxID=2908644 RepID=UPI0020277522